MSRRQELADRRAILVARCEQQRASLSVSAGGVARSLRTADAAVGVARRVSSHPFMLAGAIVAVLVIVRPNRWLPALSWGLSAAVTVQRASALFRNAA